MVYQSGFLPLAAGSDPPAVHSLASYLIDQIIMEWEYKSHRDYPSPLIIKSQELLNALSSGNLDIYQALIDTRPIHKHLFKDLVPYGFEEFAGHCRGDSVSFLKDYPVLIQGASSPCCHPQRVSAVMQQFSVSLGKKLISLDNSYQNLSPETKTWEVIRLACAASVKFCQIHPYANGNGHISRFMILAILQKYGYTATDLPIDPRPSDINYIRSIQEYGSGNKIPLLVWLLDLVEPN